MFLDRTSHKLSFKCELTPNIPIRPGTGKTFTIVEAIRQIFAKDPSSRLLVCAPSNEAADLITERLASLGKDALFRLVAPSRGINLVSEQALPFTYRISNEEGREVFSVKSSEALQAFRVVVSTCVSAYVPYGVGLQRGHYSHIFIDEAGQCPEPEVGVTYLIDCRSNAKSISKIMISIKLLADQHTRVVLSGDPKQLGPIIRSRVAGPLGMDASFLDRLASLELYNEETMSGIKFVICFTPYAELTRHF